MGRIVINRKHFLGLVVSIFSSGWIGVKRVSAAVRLSGRPQLENKKIESDRLQQILHLYGAEFGNIKPGNGRSDNGRI